MANFLLIEKCPLCQRRLDKTKFEIDAESYPDSYTYDCQTCWINSQSKFEVFRHEGFFSRIEYVSIIVKNFNITLYYDKNYAEICKVTSVQTPIITIKDIPSRNNPTLTYSNFVKMPLPQIDFQIPLTEDELYQRIKVWMTFI